VEVILATTIMEIESDTDLVGEEIGTVEPEVDKEPLVLVQIEIT